MFMEVVVVDSGNERLTFININDISYIQEFSSKLPGVKREVTTIFMKNGKVLSVKEKYEDFKRKLIMNEAVYVV